MSTLRSISVVCFLAFSGASLCAQSTPAGKEARAETVANYLRLPLGFAKQGTGKAQKYVARGQGYTIGLQGAKATISLPPAAGGKSKSISLGFSGSRSDHAVPGLELPGTINYIYGNDARKWRLGESTFGRVTYPGVYPGVDVVYYGNQQQLEFDLVLKPGADPRSVRLKVDGASGLSIDASGALRVGDGDLRIGLPKIYQEINGTRKSIAGRYSMRGRDEVAFNIDAYDRTRPLVIDPTIVYSAILGGSTTSLAFGVALDSSGNAYIAGYSSAPDFPVVNAFQSGLSVGPDGFVAKMNPAGTALLYSTYIGGSGNDEFQGIAVDSNGNAWAAGFTFSPDFPVMNAVQSTYGGAGDAMLVEFGTTGALEFSTFLGGATEEQGFAVAVDASNNAYITGYTSGVFPTTSGAFQTSNLGGAFDAFAAKFSPSGSEIYATLLGGTGPEMGYAIAADANGNAYVAGQTGSSSFTGAPTGGAQTTFGGGLDAWVAKLNAAGSQMTYFTFLGGSGSDRANAIAVDGSGDAYVAGFTYSPNLATAGTLQIPYGGGEDGFVAELNPGGTAFTWLTYLGGNRTDILQGLSLDGAGNVYVAGYTNSTNLPVASALQPVPASNTVSLFQSTNSGGSWSGAEGTVPGQVFDVSPDPVNAGTIVVTTEQGIYRTVNGGTSWTQVVPNLVNGTAGVAALLARSPAASNTIYVTQGGGYAQSLDGGMTWNTTTLGSTPFSASGLVADPLTASTAYAFASGSGVFKTTNNGTSWSAITTLPSVNVQAMAAGPDGSLYVGMSGLGIYKSTNQGTSWSAVNTGLPSGFSPVAHSITVSATTANTAYAAASGSVYTTTNGGTSWTKLSTFPAPGATIVSVSPLSASNVYVATSASEVFASADGGATWALASGLSPAGINEIVFDASTSGHAFATAFVSYSAYIAKLNPAMSAPTWLTYFGGPSSNTIAFGVAADGKGDVFVAGYRNGSGFPTTSAITTSPTTGTSAYVAEISDATASCSYTAGPSSIVLTGSPQATSFEIVAPSGCAWTAGSNQTWATVASGASGSGTGTIFVQLSQNTSGSARTATITAGGQTITITQADSSCTYVLSPASFSIGLAGGSLSTTVTTGAGCPWALANNFGDAITITSATSGTGSGPISFNVAASADVNTRTLSIPVESSTITVSQAGSCVFTFTPPSATFGAGATMGSFTVTGNNPGCSWSSVANTLTGLSITGGVSGTGNGTVTFSLAANTGDPRVGTVTVGGKVFAISQAGLAPVYVASTIVGGNQPAAAVSATQAIIPYPESVAVDSAGNAYIIGNTLSALYKLTPAGLLVRIAGNGFNGFSGDGGPAVNAQLSDSLALALDSAGNIYIADSGNARIRMISASTGNITTIAGSGSGGFAGDGGPATSASLSNPDGITIDLAGNIYVADQGNNRVRKFTVGGVITTVAGNGTSGYSGDGGAATSAELATPTGVAVDSAGNLYIADSNNNRIRKISGGTITTFAGNGVCCFSGDGGPATSAQFNHPSALALDGAGNLYIADQNDQRIRIVAGNGIIETIAGNGTYGFLGDGGAATAAGLRAPQGIVIDASDNLWIADTNNQRIRVVSRGNINTVAGGSPTILPGPFTGLAGPSSVVKDSSGNVYFADSFDNQVKKVQSNGATSIVAGTGAQGFSGDGGAASSALLNDPEGLAFDSTGNLYITDAGNYRVRKVDTSGNITTVAGNGICCYSGDGGAATSAEINYAQGITVDSSGNLYIVDTNNHRIRKVSGGTITTIAGNGTAGFSGDGAAATSAELNSPDTVAVDGSGNVYIADSGNQRIRKITGTTISTFAGTGTAGFSGDGGAATSAQLNAPRGVVFDGTGNLYIADTNNQRIREVTTAGTMITVAGNGGFGNTGDGGPAISANLRGPIALTVDAASNIYVAENSNDTIRLFTPVSVPVNSVLTVASTHSGPFLAGGTGSYSLVVTNAGGAAPTSGTVTVIEKVTPGVFSISAMSGSGWTCSLVSCNRSDALAGGASYPAITVSVNVSGTAPIELTNQVQVSSGNGASTGSSDLTLITPGALTAPTLISPANSATNASVLPTLMWTSSPEAISYDVYFGTASTPPLVANTTGTSFAPATSMSPLALNTTYFWQVVAKNSAGMMASSIFSFTTYPTGFCTYSLTPTAASFASSGGTASVGITAPAGCAWTASSNQSWLSITSDAAGSGNGSVSYDLAANTGAARNATLTIGGQTLTVTQGADYLISTITGNQQPVTASAGTSVQIAEPTAVAGDAAGNTYFATPFQNTVYKLDGSGNLTRFAGTGVCGFSGDSGLATSANLCEPYGVAVDNSGNVYIADSQNNRIREVSPAGTITTVAGIGTCCFSGDGGAATSAQVNFPEGVAVDASGNIYIADTNNNRIRKITAGVITTIAGNGTSGFSGDGSAAVAAELFGPTAVALDSSGNVYIADRNNYRIRKVSAGTITTVAGNGNCCFSGDGGAATSATFNQPQGVAVDSSGNLYIADTFDERIREVASNGVISTVAGNGGFGFAGDGGTATSTQLRSPQGVAIDASGNLLIADTGNQRIRKVTSGTINTVAGGGVTGDGGAIPFANLSGPLGIAKDAAGDIYIADTYENRVRKITPAGAISTVAGTGVQGYSGDGGAATSAMLNEPQAVAVDSSGNLYILDSNNNRVRMVSGGTITTVAGNGTCCYSGDGGAATSAQISYSDGIALDSANNIYIADTNNARIRKVSGGTITTVAGNGTNGFSGDNGAATSAELNSPNGVGVDAAGNIYIADTNNYRIRKVTGGTITTIAGTGICCFAGDGGPATSAQLDIPRGVAVDGTGNVYIADSNDQRVREISSTGTIFTLAGNGYGYTGDGGPAGNANLRNPWAITLDGSGSIYFTDSTNNAVRVLTPAGTNPVLTISSAHTGSFSAEATGSYSLTVTNAQLAGSTAGTVTVTEILPSSLTLNTMSGTGWSCTANSCTRSDVLAGGSSYPAITVSVNVSGTVPLQITNQAAVSGGGSYGSGAEDLTLIAPIGPGVPVLISPANGAMNVSVLPTLIWNASAEATSYDVYFGTSATPPFLANTTGISYVPATLMSQLTLNTQYFWQVVAKNSAGMTPSSIFSFTTYPSGFCNYVLSASVVSVASTASLGSVGITAPAGCVWTASSNQPWLTISSGASGSGTGSLTYAVAADTAGPRSATLTIAGQTLIVSQVGDDLITTGAGGQLPPTSAIATSIQLSNPTAVAGDAGGNTYIAAPFQNAVYRLDASGNLTRFAGTGVCGFSGDGGPATSASLCEPYGVAVDGSGNVYIADSQNERIREVSSGGTITTIAGTGNCCFSGDGGPATNAWLNFPQGVALDVSGNIYIADTNNNRIRKISGGVITTIAGNGTFGYSGDGSAAGSAELASPSAVAVDFAGDVYIADRGNDRIRKVTGGTITTVAGNGCCFGGDGGPATSAQFNQPQGIAVDSSGNLYIADTFSNRIRQVGSNGVIQTIAGNGFFGFLGDGGTATSAQLRSPQGVAIDASGNLLIADTNNLRIRKVVAGTINTVAGSWTAVDGLATPFANLSGPQSVAADASGNIYIAETYANRIRMFSFSTGAISTVAGTGVQGYSGDGGAATGAMLNEPQAVAVDSSGNLYILDSNNNRVRMVSGGIITTVAGNGTCCYSGDGGAATSAQIGYSNGLAIDSSNNIYIADTNNNRIRKVSGGTITTVAGNGTFGYSGDSSAATGAELASPNGVAVDGTGNIYIADSNNYRIRKVSGGTITTVAGNGTCCYSGDGGPATSAQLNVPRGLFVGAAGNIFIADTNNQRIRLVTTAGTILTLAGSGNYGYTGDGGPALAASFRSPQALTGSQGNLLVVDTGNNALRVLALTGSGELLTLTSTHSGSFPAGGTGTYSLTISNAALAAPTNGDTVTVTELLPPALTLNSMSGSGWSCTGSSCSRNDSLAGGASYPPITVSVNVSAMAPLQITNQAFSPGFAAAAEDLTLITPNPPPAPVLTSPANGATNVSILPTLTWNASVQATSYDVYFGTSPTPAFLANTTGISYTPFAALASLLAENTTYYWQVVAKNSAGMMASSIFSFTTYPPGYCTYSLNPTAASISSAGGAGSVGITAPAGCLWTGSSNQSWLTITSAVSGMGNGTINYSASASPGGPRTAMLAIGGQAFTVSEAGQFVITTIVGAQQPPVAAQGTSFSLAPPEGVAVDSAGNTYISIQNLNAVYKLDGTGMLTRFAGTGVCGFSGDGSSAIAAQLCNPNGLGIDSSGNLYIADSGNNRIREVNTAGVITTVAGSGICCTLGDGGTASSAWINNPYGVSVDGSGNIYIADSNNNRIRKVAVGGIITTVAGSSVCCTLGDGGVATSAWIATPRSVIVDSASNIYIADTNNNRIRKVTSGGTITTIAGTNVCCTLGDGGAATGAWISGPSGLALDASGDLYFGDSNNQRIREISVSGAITTVAGNGNYGSSGDGGAATSAMLRTPQAIAIDGSGNLVIADTYGQRVRRVSGGTINTIAGGVTAVGDGGPLPFAILYEPGGVVKDSSGNLYIADTYNNRVRKITSAGVMSTFAGTGVQGYSGDGGAAASALLNQPESVALDSSGNLYIYDSGNSRVRMVSGGTITTVAGNGSCCYSGDGGAATSAQISYGNGITLDNANNIYIADTNNNRIRRVSGGIINTVAGNGTFGYSGDGGAATNAELASPFSVAVDTAGNIYIADTNNQRIRKVTGGAISTFAGNGACCATFGDGGPAASAQISNARGVAVDTSGNLYIADTYNGRIREVTGGNIATLAGNGGYGLSGDGGNSLNASFRTPQTMTVDSSGNIYIADTFNNAIRVMTPVASNPVLAITSTHTGSFSSGGAGSYALTVSNSSLAGSTAGTVTVTEALPSSLTVNTISGSGWSCTGSSCTRSDALGAGGSYPVITVTVNVSGAAPSQVTNEVTASGGGAGITGSEDLTLVSQPAANITTVAPNSAYTGAAALPVTVSGTGITSGSNLSFNFAGVTTVIAASVQSAQLLATIPAALLTTAGTAQLGVQNASGALSNTLPFTISAAPVATITTLAPNSAFRGSPALPLTVSGTNIVSGSNLSFNLGGVTTVVPATVSSAQLLATLPSALLTTAGTAQLGVLNPSGVLSNTLPFTISTAPLANITSIAPNSAPPGSPAVPVTISGSNLTSGSTLLWSLGSTNASLATTLQSAQLLATIPAALLSTAGTAQVSVMNISGGISNQLPFQITTGVPDLTLTAHHTGNFEQGQAGIYTLTASNVGAGITTGTVTVTDTLPAGLTALSMSGSGWACAVFPSPSCSRSDSLAAGSSYSSIALTVAAASSAPTSVTNSAAVSGGGETNLANDTASDLTTVQPALSITTTSLPVQTSGVAFTVNLNVTGGSGTYTWSATGVPGWLTLSPAGALSGTPPSEAPVTLTATVNDGTYSTGQTFTLSANQQASPQHMFTVSTVAGQPRPSGVPGTSTFLQAPQGLAFDSAGNLYVVEVNGGVVRKINPGNTSITTIAGGLGNQSPAIGFGGLATSAAFSIPRYTAVDSIGDVFVSDSGNCTVDRIDPVTRILTVYAGTSGSCGFGGDSGPATSAQLNNNLRNIALDAAGDLFISDTANLRVRRVDAVTHTITTYAGNGGSVSGDNGPATSAGIGNVTAIAFDNSGNLFVGGVGRIRRVDRNTGVITPYAGTGSTAFNGDNIAAASANFGTPRGMVFDSANNLYFSDLVNLRIRRIDGTTQNITTIAGTGTSGVSGDGGPGTSAQFLDDEVVVFDAGGNLYFSDFTANRIRKLTPGGAGGTWTISTYAGSAGADNTAPTSAFINWPSDVVLDGSGNVFVAESLGARIREVNSTGTNISTFAGTGFEGDKGDGGSAVNASIFPIGGAAIDKSGNFYFADGSSSVIRKIDTGGNITTVAGNATAGPGFSGDGGQATSAQLQGPEGVAVDASGNLYISDSGNNAIRVVSASTGIITTVAGTPPAAGFASNGTIATSAALSSPSVIKFDSSGNLYVADQGNSVVRKIGASDGKIVTIAGNGTAGYSGDGQLATSAQLNAPTGIALAANGDLYITDTNGVSDVRLVTAATGLIETIAGTGANGYSGDGGPATAAQLNSPIGLTVDATGRVWIADRANDVIRLLTPVGMPSIYIDAPVAGAELSGTVTISGWAIESFSSVGPYAINAVTVLVDGTMVGSATYGAPRADVCAAFPDRLGCPNVGWNYDLNASALSTGPHTLTIVATDTGGNSTSRQVIFSAGVPPSVYIDVPTAGATLSGAAAITGWALESVSSVGLDAVSSVTVFVDGTMVGTATYGASRSDVCAAFPGRPGCPNVGWNYSLDTTTLAAGAHILRIAATDTGNVTGSNQVSFNVSNAVPPFIYVDTPTANATLSGVASVSGWSIENLTMVGPGAVSEVDVYVDGVKTGVATYGSPRADVCSAFPGRLGCPNVGWSYALDTTMLAAGAHTLKIVATDTASITGSTQVPFNVVNVVPPFVYIDAPAANATVNGVVSVSGWSIENLGVVGPAAVSRVDVYVDSVKVGSATYGMNRADVCSAFPGRMGCPNVGWSYSLDTTSLAAGAHTLTIVATDTANVTGSNQVNFTVAVPPFVYIDAPTANATVSGVTSISGWSIENLTVVGPAAVAEVDVYVDAVKVGTATYGGNRADVCAAFTGRLGCPNVGWSYNLDTTTLAGGAHTLKIVAIDTAGTAGSNQVNFNVSNAVLPFVYIDTPAANATLSGVTPIQGWAIENLSVVGPAAVSKVDVYVDSVKVGSATYGMNRADVCSAFPGRMGCPAVGWSYNLDTTTLTAGTHTLMIVATDTANNVGSSQVNFMK